MRLPEVGFGDYLEGRDFQALPHGADSAHDLGLFHFFGWTL